MFKSVLFPTDFSPLNERLGPCLPDMTRLGVEEIVLLNVVELGPQIGFASDTFESMLAWKKDVEPKLSSLEAKIKSQGLRCHWRLELGKPALEIVRVAHEEHVSLIVIGSHGHGFLRGVLLGSVTHDVVRYAMTPVLVLKQEIANTGAATDCDFVSQHLLRRVLLPTDFTEHANEALCLVKTLASAGLKDVVVLHVKEKDDGPADQQRKEIEAKLARVREELEFFGFVVKVVVAEGSPAKLVDQVAREEDVSLIVLGSQERSAQANGLPGSVSEQIVSRHIRPVLVAKPRVGFTAARKSA